MPYKSTLHDAYVLAFDIGECCGYYARKLDDERLEVQGGYEPYPVIITYRDGRVVDVAVVKE